MMNSESLVTQYIKGLGGYESAKNSSFPWLVNHGENWKNVKDVTLLEYRREHTLYELGDRVFLEDPNFPDMWLITNILDDGRVELKTAIHGFPVPDACWGMYYGPVSGFRHATDEEIKEAEA